MTLKVELVSPSERVWSGEASFVSARTVEGDLGILTDHAPLFGVLDHRLPIERKAEA